ncbi:MW1434 family type I TA system toxin [Streptomyces sp. NPDC087300]|uniref:Thoeris anti-defense Tad2 family protein n=1 Tax=Streptomyces sp. NPDC087300 TaxID=3365780 RepID=UPI003805F11A
MSDMNFGQALDFLRTGHRMARRAWPEGTWLVLRTGYPDGIAVNANSAEAFGVPEGTTARFAPYFQLCDTYGTLHAWARSDEDLLDADWYNVDPHAPLGARRRL